MKENQDSKIARWKTADGLRLAEEVFHRLATNKPLHDLKLGEHNKRVDVRGICAPEVSKAKMPPFRNWSLQKLSGQVTFKNVHFEDMDFSGAQLAHLRFFNSRITNCRFDNAQCEDWRLWAADVSSTTFFDANLYKAVLGPWYEGRGNTYRLVNFSRADMFMLNSPAATYIDCDFSHARLEKIEFQSSSFIRCRFAGELREVIFWNHGYKTGKPDPNPMEDVDFSEAKLRWVEFRRLNLDRVLFPQDDTHVVLRNYECVLQKALLAARNSQHQSANGIAAVFQHRLKWIGLEQEVGVFNLLDFREAGGVEEEEFVSRILRQAELECARPQ